MRPTHNWSATILDDPNIDAVVAGIVPLTPAHADPRPARVTASRSTTRVRSCQLLPEIAELNDKPVVAVIDSGTSSTRSAKPSKHGGLPVFRSADRGRQAPRAAWTESKRPRSIEARSMKIHTVKLTSTVRNADGLRQHHAQVEEAVARAASRRGCAWSTPCTSPPACSSTTTSPGCTTTTSAGSRSSRPSTPSPERYHHNRTGEDNGDAHHKRQIMGREVVVAITDGRLDFGPWEQIFYGEFDGRRPKRVLVKIIGE